MRIGEGCAKRAADQAISEMRDEMRTMMASIHLVKGIVSRADLGLIYGKDPQTIKRWAERHNFQEVDGPASNTIYYDIEDIKKKVRAAERDLDL
jgi:hypothetical protein